LSKQIVDLTQPVFFAINFCSYLSFYSPLFSWLLGELDKVIG
jgi:hypothetical protein